MDQRWPLVGRNAALAGCAARVRPGDGVLITGPAGVGKTRLARELASQAAAGGAWVTTIVATEAGALLPGSGWGAILPSAALQDAMPLLPVLRDELRRRADASPVIVVVDDAQHLDEVSASLVHQLADASELGVIATQRSGTTAPEGITRLWHEGRIDRVDLDALTEDDVAELARHLAGAPLDETSGRRLREITGGNPLFVREVLAAAASTGDLELVDSEARLHAIPAGAPRLADLVGARMRHLPDDDARAMLVIALADTVARELLPAWIDDGVLQRLVSDGLVAVGEAGADLVVGCSHPLYGEVLRAAATPLDRRATFGALLDAASHSGRPLDPMQRVLWARAAGREVDRATLVAAARIARFAHELDVALDLAEQAWDLDPDFELGDLLADIRYEIGDPDGCDAHRRAWVEVVHTEDERIRVCINQAITAYWRRGDADSAFAALDDAAARGPSPWRDEAAALRATLLAVSGRAADALAEAAPLLERQPDRVLIQAALAASHALRCNARAEDAIQICHDALAAYASLGEQVALFTEQVLAASQAIAMADVGRLDDAADLADRVLRRSRDSNEISGLALAAMVQGQVRLQRGQMETAIAAFRLAETSFDRARHPGMRIWALSGLCLAQATAGRVGDAAATWSALDTAGSHPALIFENARARAGAWLAHAQGDAAGARSMLADAAARVAARGDLMGSATCLYDMARLGGSAAHTAPLHHIAAAGQGPMLTAMSLHAEGLQSGRVETLTEAAERFEAIGMHLYAAEAAFAAAAAARGAGDQRLAARWSSWADACRTRCDAAVTPGLLADLAPVPLTRREREIALLAAQGVASREIGERLFVSRRTVESHLARIYDKVGVRSRTQLAEVMAAQIA